MSHIHDKIDYTAETFIVNQNRVLLRRHDKYDIWLSVGGHIELDEDPNQAAVREVKEEVGLDIKLIGDTSQFEEKDYRELIPPRFLNRNRINPTHEHITLTYFARSQTDDITSDEECRWFTREEIESNQYGIKDSIKFYALRALEVLKKTKIKKPGQKAPDKKLFPDFYT